MGRGGQDPTSGRGNLGLIPLLGTKAVALVHFFLLVFSFYFFSSFLTGMSPVEHTART